MGVCGNPCRPGLLEGRSVGLGEDSRWLKLVPGGLSDGPRGVVVPGGGKVGPSLGAWLSYRIPGTGTEGMWRMVDPCRGLRAVRVELPGVLPHGGVSSALGWLSLRAAGQHSPSSRCCQGTTCASHMRVGKTGCLWLPWAPSARGTSTGRGQWTFTGQGGAFGLGTLTHFLPWGGGGGSEGLCMVVDGAGRGP